MKFCTKCGKQHDDDAVFCSGCGYRFKDKNLSGQYQNAGVNAANNTPHDRLKRNTEELSGNKNHFKNNEKKSAGPVFIFSGIAATILSIIGAALNNSKSVNGFLRIIDKTYDILVKIMFEISGRVFIGLIFIGIASIIAGIIIKHFNAVKVMPSTVTVLVIIVPVLIVLISILLMFPYIAVSIY